MKTSSYLPVASFLLACAWAAHAAPGELSRGVYRIPYVTGTQVYVSRDHNSHSPEPNRYDLVGTGGRGPYRVAAAADGIVRFVVDWHTETGECADNNYVWIEHPNGEWTKYSHMQTGTASGAAGLFVGKAVCAGTYLGDEDDVGCAAGIHCHFEVGVPDDLTDPIQDSGGYIKGVNRIPVICGIPGNIMIQGQTYTAAPCGSGGCDDNLVIPAQTVDNAVVYMAGQQIDSMANLIEFSETGRMLLSAGNRIRLRAGFVAGPGSYLQARIRACNETLGLPQCALIAP